MSELTPEASRLYRVRKTTVKMLHNRGYIVSENELVMTPEAFQGQVSGPRPSILFNCVSLSAATDARVHNQHTSSATTRRAR
jgi:hypothetical protein